MVEKKEDGSFVQICNCKHGSDTATITSFTNQISLYLVKRENRRYDGSSR